MVIRSEKNLYPGVNPHLNSALQQRGGGWKSFHAYHIIHLADRLNEVLPPAYLAKPEDSLQISVYEPLPVQPEGVVHHRSPDVLITRQTTSYESSAALLEPAMPTLTIPVLQVLDEEDELTALVIYQEHKPITQIELLSPANKPEGGHYSDYLRNRYEALSAGLRLVEVDYLHERHPISDDIPSYKARHSNAYPFHILVTDPRPKLSKAMTAVFSWGVADPLPIINIPLEEKDAVQLDFGAVYSQTYSKRPFWGDVDYTKLPSHFEVYSLTDQEIIRAYMARIASEQ